MERLPMMFVALFTIWFLLLNQQLHIQTAGFVVESYKEYINEELLESTESTTFSNDTTWIDHFTEIYATTEEAESLDDDVIELNVGGQKITTLRSTLTAVPNSKLAQMFTKNTTSTYNSKDKQGAVFFDYNPVQFNYLLDQLRTIKRTPEIPAYEINIAAPNVDIRSNFSYMLSDLKLNPEQFLSPLSSAHVNLRRDSLVGWQECYRSTYDTPFELIKFLMKCKSSKFLVACNPVDNTETLTLAGVLKWQDVFHVCSQNTYCTTEIKNGMGFYYAKDQAWGFEGQPMNSASTYNGQAYINHGHSQTSINLNPCDSSDQNSEYRLCWSLRSNVHRGGGDRCGRMKNLHNAANWERIIYRAV